MKEVILYNYIDKGKDDLNGVRHTHGESYEILFVRGGSGSVIIRDKFFPLREGTVYFINGNELHCTVPDIFNEYIRSKIVISAGFIDKMASALGCGELVEELFLNGGTYFVPNEEEIKYIDTEFCSIERALGKNSRYTPASVAASIMNIMFTGHKKQNNALLPGDERMTDILDQINKNISEKLTLEDICEYAHLSKYHLCREFKRKVGMSVFDYILSRRLAMAQRYLAESEMSISEIAEASGFASCTYFSKVFRECEGMTPGEFRKKNKNIKITERN